jgi:hypothetical protein
MNILTPASNPNGSRSDARRDGRSCSFLLLTGLLIPFVLAAAACSKDPAAPADLDLSDTKTTHHGLYMVRLQPRINPIPLNRIHEWTVQVRKADGAPRTDAVLRVDGGMPQHGHGLPTSPRVTAHLGNGEYLVEGMKFTMGGWWVLKVYVQATTGADSVTFNLIL